MKKSNKVICGLIVIVLLVVMVVGGYFLVKISRESKEKISSLENEIETLKGEKENSNTQNKSEVSSDTKNEDKPIASKNEDSLNKKSETEIANEAIRKALKDKEWLKKNVIPENEYYEEENMRLTFLCLKKENDGTPMVIVQFDNLANGGTMSCALVSYKNGRVDTQLIEQGMVRKIQVDANDRVVCFTINDGGNPAVEYYKIKNKIASLADSIKQVSYSGEECKFFKGIVNSDKYKEITEEEFESIVEKYGSNMVTIETELNEKNIDKYLK